MSSLEARLIDNAEVEELQNRIDSLDNEDAMDAGVMDGFLTAMAINPGSSSDEDVLPFIFSDQGNPSAIPDDARLLELIGLRRKENQGGKSAGLSESGYGIQGLQARYQQSASVEPERRNAGARPV